MQGWTGVFLVIIAVNAIVQAALVFGLFFGLRLLNRNLDKLEAQVDQEVRPRIDDLTGVAARLRTAAEAARAQSIRLDTAFTSRVGGLQRHLDRTLGRFGEAAQDAVHRMGEAVSPRESGGWSSALLSGLLRGLEMWRDWRDDDEATDSDDDVHTKTARSTTREP